MPLPVQMVACLALVGWGLSRPHAAPDPEQLALLLAALLLELSALRLPAIGFFSLAFPVYLAEGLSGGPGTAQVMAVLALGARTLLLGSPQPGLRLREGLADGLPAMGALAVLGVTSNLGLQILLATQVHVLLTVMLRGGLGRCLQDSTLWVRASGRLTAVLPALGLLGGLLHELLQRSLLSGLWMLPVLAVLRYLLGEARFGIDMGDYHDMTRTLASTRATQQKLSTALERTREGLSQKEEEVRALETLSAALAQTTSVDSCLDRLLEVLGRMVDCRSLAVFLLEPDGYLNPRCARGPHATRLASARQHGLHDPMVEQAFGRVFQGPRLFPDEPHATALPVGSYGVLYAGRVNRPFEAAEEKILAVGAGQAAVALAAAARFETQTRALQQHAEAVRRVDPNAISPQAGALLNGRYRLIRVVKSGGMGAVYQAEDTHLDGVCAVKEMLAQHLGGEASLIQRKFEEERALLARLNHAGIPRVRDFFRRGGLCYIVMDYIHGANFEQELADCIALTGHPFLPDVLVRDSLGILDILIYLHSLEPPVIHRDIKPANLIREYRTGRIMLVDFGLARSVAGGPTQTAIGTLGYSPVEQMQGRAEIRSDLYALGVTMGQLLTGRPPMPMEFKAVREVDPSLDTGLAAIVDRASALDAARRYPDAASMRQDLLAWQARRCVASKA